MGLRVLRSALIVFCCSFFILPVSLQAEGQYHFSLSSRQLFGKPDEITSPNDYGTFQTYLGVSGWDNYGYGNFEIGIDWLANFRSLRFTLGLGRTVTFGPEIHTHYDGNNEQWGWGMGPSFNYNSKWFTLSVNYPFDFSTSLSKNNPDSDMVSGLELVLRLQWPVPTPKDPDGSDL